MITQKVCGGVVYRITERGIQYLILKRAKYHNGVKWIEANWTIPKAVKTDMQSDEATALNQVKTETGMNVEFRGEFYEGRPYVFYWDGQRIKRENHYLLFQTNNGTTPNPGEGITDYYWGSLKEVKKKMSLPSSAKVFENAEKTILNAQSSTQPLAGDKNNS